MTAADDRRREELAFGREIRWDEEGLLDTVFFGPQPDRGFPPLPVGNARTLLENGYVDPDERHAAAAPTAATLIDWATEVRAEYRDYQFEVGLVGYMTSPERADAGITFEGVSIRSPGSIPAGLQAEVAKAFSPDVLAVDDVELRLQWE